jgi:hypothetical protein
MKFQKQLSQIVNSDDSIADSPDIQIFSYGKDSNHFSRRLQQRAINWDMIRVAIAYGSFQHYDRTQIWTLLDKNLQFTPYERFMDKLRGLRIIANSYAGDDSLRPITAYWKYDLRR